MELAVSRLAMQHWIRGFALSSRCFSIGLKKYSPPRQPNATSSHTRSALSALELLDEAKIFNGRKLNQSLEPKQKVKVSSETNGVLQATALELVDDLNAALATPQLSSLFRSVPNASEVLEISKVVLNRDMSHADAFWTSKISVAFIETLSAKDSITKQDVAAANSMVHNINNKLQARESKFRSHIIKSFDFRRVPRVFFRPDAKLEQQLRTLEQRRQDQGDF
eukprot:gene38374-46638_t